MFKDLLNRLGDGVRKLLGSRKYYHELIGPPSMPPLNTAQGSAPSLKMTPRPTPTPTLLPVKPTSRPPVPIPLDSYQPGHPRYMELNKNQGTSSIPVRQPPMNIADAIWAEFPQDATAAATVAFGENMGYDVNAINPYNRNKTIDYGLFQNNSGTFAEMLAKAPFRNQLNESGIFSMDDLMGDARKSAAGARVRTGYGKPPGGNPWNWWYGWKDRGFDPYGYKK